MKNSFLAILAIFSLTLGFTAMAQDGVNQRVQNQENRIDQGEKNGALTPGQADKLQNRDNKIEAQAQKDENANGGKLTPGEKRRLNKRLNRTSRAIHNEKHGG
jgi:hypothetical protein